MAEIHTDGTESRPGGVFGSLKKLAANAVGIAQTRLEILSTEIQEEKIRIVQILVWGFAALVFFALGIAFLAVFITVLLWDSHRLLALGAFTLLFLGGGAAALAMARAKAGEGTRLFADSLGELAKDKQSLTPP